MRDPVLVSLQIALLALLLTAGGLPAATGAESDTPEADPAQGRAELQIYKNPATGMLEAPPRALLRELPAPALRALSTSPRGLSERPGSSRAGGVGLHLRGRFRRALVASRGADGTLELSCHAGQLKWSEVAEVAPHEPHPVPEEARP